MPTNLTQVEDIESGKTILRVEGELTFADAVFLEKIALEMRNEIGKNLTIDLADVYFLDSESAPIIRRIEREHGFEIVGVEIQRALNANFRRNGQDVGCETQVAHALQHARPVDRRVVEDDHAGSKIHGRATRRHIERRAISKEHAAHAAAAIEHAADRGGRAALEIHRAARRRDRKSTRLNSSHG